MISIFLFYDKCDGKQSMYTSKGIRHCKVICFDGKDFILIESKHHGIGFRRIKALNCVTMIKHLKSLNSLVNIIVTYHEKHKKIMWFPLWIRSCNEICRYASGVDIGITFNPTHMIKKLLKYNNKTNYEIIYFWSTQNGFR